MLCFVGYTVEKTNSLVWSYLVSIMKHYPRNWPNMELKDLSWVIWIKSQTFLHCVLYEFLEIYRGTDNILSAWHCIRMKFPPPQSQKIPSKHVRRIPELWYRDATIWRLWSFSKRSVFWAVLTVQTWWYESFAKLCSNIPSFHQWIGAGIRGHCTSIKCIINY